MLSMHVSDRARILASADPPTVAARRRAETVVGKGTTAPIFMLLPWTAGVDGLALQQAIENVRRGRRAAPTLN
jgi:hypothetical protein